MSKQSEKVKVWRKRTKQRIIDAMGGKCCICGYSKCHSALALHHLDPSQKDIALSSIRANPKNWNTIAKELRKCVLLCHVCHCETHEGIVSIPSDAPKFDEKFVDYKKLERDASMTPCPMCQKLKVSYHKHCSASCAHRSRRKIDWETIDLQKELQTKSFVTLAEELGCSDNAIRKRLKSLGYNPKTFRK